MKKNKKHKLEHKGNLGILRDLKVSILISLIAYIILFCILYINKQMVYDIIKQPITKILPTNNIDFVYTNIFESFTADISLCGYTAFLLSIPVFLYSMYRFFAPSLYQNEKKMAVCLSIFGTIMLIISFVMLYFFIFPNAINFFVLQDIQNGRQFARPLLKISEYIDTFFHMVIGFGLVFQTPLVLFGLVKLGLIKKTALQKHRKMVIVIIFIISAIITPPDVLSQIICALLLIILYEITNIIIQHTDNKKQSVSLKK